MWYGTSPERTGERMEDLSSKEIEVLRWLVEGKTSIEIAKILHRGHQTVKRHAGSILHKLDATNMVQAAVIAVRMGII